MFILMTPGNSQPIKLNCWHTEPSGKHYRTLYMTQNGKYDISRENIMKYFMRSIQSIHFYDDNFIMKK